MCVVLIESRISSLAQAGLSTDIRLRELAEGGVCSP
jgi:hypothetical protein